MSLSDKKILTQYNKYPIRVWVWAYIFVYVYMYSWIYVERNIYLPGENSHLLLFKFFPCKIESFFLFLFLRHNAYTLQNFKDMSVLERVLSSAMHTNWFNPLVLTLSTLWSTSCVWWPISTTVGWRSEEMYGNRISCLLGPRYMD